MRQDHIVNFIKYLGLLLNRAAKKSVLLTDRLTILIVPFTALILWMTGAKMTDTIEETLFLGVAMTVVAVVILRLVAASYFVWKEDRAEIAGLKTALDSPRFREAEVMNDHRLELRKELGDRLAWLVTYAEAQARVVDANVMYDNGERLFAQNFSRAREIVSQLSYDVALRVVCLNLIRLAANVAQHGLTDADESGKSPTLDRLWQQRKLTFKLLHRQDLHEVITLAEIENLIMDHGEDFGDSALHDLRKLLREHPELADDQRMVTPPQDGESGKIWLPNTAPERRP